MSDQAALAAALVVLIPVLLSGLPIAFSLLLVSIAYFAVTGDDPSIASVNMFWFLNKSELVSIPFFILAADILGRSRAMDDLVAASEAMFGWLRGGLALVTMVSTIIFSAISGSSVATAVAIGRVMIPKLVEAGYRRRFAVGLVASGGGLGILIPPSVPLIIYATVAEISVADVFLAAMGPGLLMGLVFCVFVVAMGNRVRDPGIEVAAARLPWPERFRMLARALPIMVLPVLILGGIYGGLFTPGQAAAVAVIYAAILSLTYYRRPGMEPLYRLVAEAGRLAATILMIMAATSVFGYIITQNRIPFHFAQFIDDLGLSPFLFLVAVNVLLLLLGCVLEIISVILITLPIFLPILTHLDISLVHFAIVMIINMELAVITPPIGMNLFVISTISNVPILRVFRGTLPFAALMLAMLLLCTYSEGISLATLRLFRG